MIKSYRNPVYMQKLLWDVACVRINSYFPRGQRSQWQLVEKVSRVALGTMVLLYALDLIVPFLPLSSKAVIQGIFLPIITCVGLSLILKGFNRLRPPKPAIPSTDRFFALQRLKNERQLNKKNSLKTEPQASLSLNDKPELQDRDKHEKKESMLRGQSQGYIEELEVVHLEEEKQEDESKDLTGIKRNLLGEFEAVAKEEAC
jgi:hypothetical protein